MLSFAFPFCLVDEAGQATEPEVLVPLCRGVQQAVLIGDHRQLPPVVSCAKARQGGLSLSMFERVASRGFPVRMLQVQYRMHPAISKFPSTEFYSGLLLDAPNVQNRSDSVQFPWPSAGVPLFFWSIPGREETPPNGMSFFNQEEALAVCDAVRRLASGGASASQIGVCSFYKGKVTQVRRLLQQAFPRAFADDISVSSADGFQGSERDYMVISLVRTGSRLGFSKDPRRVNVALTRARKGLIIIGSVPAYREEPMYSRLLSDFSSRWLLFQGNLDDPRVCPFREATDDNHERAQSFLLELVQRFSPAPPTPPPSPPA